MNKYLLIIFVAATLTACSSGSVPYGFKPKAPPEKLTPQPLQIDWKQPPVACAEEIIPHPAQRVCLDLSKIVNVLSDWPQELSNADRLYWQSQKSGMTYCRAKELLRREEVTPGSYTPGSVQTAWMRAMAIEDHDTKVRAVYQASEAYGIPPQILTGALFQESLFSQLGVAADGGNYSCGIGQMNISEWCDWAITQSEEKKIAIGFPLEVTACNIAPAGLLKPYYDIALTRLNGLPEYRLMPEHFAEIPLENVVAGFPVGTPELQQTRHNLVNAFLGNCRNSQDAIVAKGFQLTKIFQRFVPEGLKQVDTYQPGESYGRLCMGNAQQTHTPVATPWLLAVAIYNAGPRAVDMMAHYNRLKTEHLPLPENFYGFTPLRLVESFYWGGQYNPETDGIHFFNLQGVNTRWEWFKSCVLQRHVARVVQHVLLPDTPKFIDSLENGITCKKSSVDAITGEKISGVPDFRKESSGLIE